MADDIGSRAIALHREKRGKLEVRGKMSAQSAEGLSLAYTPGVAAVCKEIAKNPEAAYELTLKWNAVAVVSDGSRVLGLGNIGALASLPVMEGKALLFKEYGNIDAFPICLSTQDEDEIVVTVARLAPSFAGINLEDIESPKCFSIERRLQEKMKIPVFHDDQHGTAVVVLAGVLNALRLCGKKKEGAKVVVSGAGAAGYGITKLLVAGGFSEILVCDSKGILEETDGMLESKRELARITNPHKRRGKLSDALFGADVFIGVSSPNILTSEMVKTMASGATIFALSNPVPEIGRDAALLGGARIYGTARADMPNQINNVLGFPGIFRGALLVRARTINGRMKLAAAHALAGVLPASELSDGRVLPLPFDRRVVPAVATAVAKEAMASGVAGLKLTDSQIKKELISLNLLEG
ncbi:MAG: NADP-dependent malic enzyme [Candidatus Micrarchaeia archaeon]|jgi:malate dehydrogenase (oxaloacetate-decarboxylating)